MVRNKRVERAHRALHVYLQPRLRKGADVEFLSAFVGATDEKNIDAKLPAIIDEVTRLTANELAMDASTKDLFAKMHAAIAGEEGTTNMNIDDETVKKILGFLQPKLTPDELRHVYAMLMEPSPAAAKSDQKKGRRNPDGTAITPDAAEDSAARVAFAKRWPDAAKIVIEPNVTPEMPRHEAPDAQAFFKRFPNAARIGQAL